MATVIIWHEIRGEAKYGIQTTGYDHLQKSLSDADLKHASMYQPINYLIAEWLLDNVTNEELINGHLLDAGCGKGRILAMAAHKGFTHISGFDLSPAMCSEAIQTINYLQQRNKQFTKTKFTIENADASNYIPQPDVNVIFLFNPFDEFIMQPFVQNVTTSLEQYPRSMKILYANPEHKKFWIKGGFKETNYIQKLNWLQASVLEWQPDNNRPNQ